MRVSTLLYTSLFSAALAVPTYRENPLRHLETALVTGDSSGDTADFTDADRAQAVKDGFNFAWNGYMKYAFPHDQLRPVTNTFSDPRNGWGATAVDALSTALVMELPDVVNTILDYVPKIDYTTSATGVSLFETTIRYLAGMLAGYDLLKGPSSHLTNKTTAVDALLAQSIKLANTLSFAFNTPSGVPANNIFTDGTTDGGTTSGLAVVGSLVMEWTHLSDLTGNQTYASISQKAQSHILDPKPAWAEPFPGLVGTGMSLATGEFLDANGGWVGGDDSAYEYLIKMYIYDTTRFATYKDRWVLAADSSMAHLTSHPSTRSDITFLAEYHNQSLVLDSQHLACFDGGNFILGGLVLKEQKYIDFGLELTNGCHETYSATPSSIGPESFSWDPNHVPADQVAFFNKAGYWITNPDYDLRPEVLESYYYAYRATKDKKYQDWAWDAFLAINRTTTTESGYSQIKNVMAADGGAKENVQESFLFAEVMKYAYLIHTADADYQVNNQGVNKYVFNTEAHPFKVWGPPT